MTAALHTAAHDNTHIRRALRGTQGHARWADTPHVRFFSRPDQDPICRRLPAREMSALVLALSVYGFDLAPLRAGQLSDMLRGAAGVDLGDGSVENAWSTVTALAAAACAWGIDLTMDRYMWRICADALDRALADTDQLRAHTATWLLDATRSAAALCGAAQSAP